MQGKAAKRQHRPWPGSLAFAPDAAEVGADLAFTALHLALPGMPLRPPPSAVAAAAMETCVLLAPRRTPRGCAACAGCRGCALLAKLQPSGNLSPQYRGAGGLVHANATAWHRPPGQFVVFPQRGTLGFAVEAVLLVEAGEPCPGA
jgi:hypothetical protein